MRDIFSESGRVKCSSPRQGQTVSGKTGIGYFSNLEKELTSLLLLPASLLFYFITVRKNLLSKAGAVSAAGMAILLVLFCGWMFLLPLLFFFLSSVAAGKILKKNPVLSDEKQGKARDAMQVWANGGVYLLFCLADAVYPGLFLSAAAVSISISTSDTLSSEIGMALKGKTIDLLRLKKTMAGISGGISLAGSLAGLAGALAASAICMISLEGISGEYWLIIALFGLAGMFIDSLLGSALQVKYFNEDLQAWSDRPTNRSSKRKGMAWIGNDTVNVLSQLLGCGIFLAWLFLARSH